MQPQGYDRELSRTDLEKYSYKRIGGGWLVVPALIMLGGLGYVAISLFTKAPIDWAFVGLLTPFGAAVLIIVNCDEQWDTRLRHKQAIKREDATYRFLPAPKDYEHTTFTDSALECVGYVLAKASAIWRVWRCWVWSPSSRSRGWEPLP